jgi:predicted phosphodiesterase
MRIFAISDLHTDVRANREALALAPLRGHRDDVLIVAGDVADNESVLADTLALLAARFRAVFFVPGNHELWVRGEKRTSIDKFHAVLQIAEAAGVRTTPARIGGAWVVPLFSWYTPAFDVKGEGVEAELEGWSDRYFCRWPEGAPPEQTFLAMNEPFIRRYDAPVVTFSHFVPRPELVPDVRWLRFRGLPLVAGSEGIERQIRRIGAAVHVFGHTHIPADQVIDGVRYVQNYFRPALPGSDASPFQLVWEDASVGEGTRPLFC